MTMKRLRSIFALLVLITVSNAEEANKKSKAHSRISCATSKLTYMYDTCSCGAKEMTAVLDVKARKKATKRPAVSLTSVMDVSGSMVEEMSLMQDANIFMVNKLTEFSEPHRFGSVTFHTDVEELTPLELLTPTSAKKINDKIRATTDLYMTNLFGGIKEGFEQQKRDPRNDPYVRVVFVFTDGQPNAGISVPYRIIEEVEALVAQRPDIAIYTFALGTDIDYILSRRIAEAGRGTFSIIEKSDEMASAFGKALGGVASQVGDSIKYTFVPRAGVTITDVMTSGTLSDGAKGSKIVDLGDLEEEEQRSITVKIKLDRGCLTAKPLEVHGECVDSSTGLPSTDDTIIPPLDMVRVPPQCNADDDVVGETLRHGAFKKRYERAIEAKRRRDNFNTAMQLKGLLEDIKQTKLKKKADWLIKGEEDTKGLLGRLKQATNTDQDLLFLDDMYSVYDAVVKQRTGSTNENLESVKFVTTTAKATMVREAKGQVLKIKPVSLFTLSIRESVSETKSEGDDNFIDVVYSLKASSMKGDRPPLSLTVVVDTSQSMSTDAMKIVVATLKRLVDWIGSKKDVDVLLGVITFGGKVRELLPLSKFSAIDVPAVKASFDAIRAGGIAKIKRALVIGVNQQAPLASCTGSQAVFLLSNSASLFSTDTIVQTLQAQLASLNSPVSVYTFALKAADAVQMERIAAAGKGQHYTLPSPKDIPYSFGDAIGGLLGISAKHVMVTFTPADNDVEIVSVFPGGESQGQGAFNASALNVFEQEKIHFLASVRFPVSSNPVSILRISASYTNASTCRIADSPVVLINTDEKSPESIDQRRLDRNVAVILKEAADICMTTPDLENVKSMNQEAYDIAERTVIKSDRYRWGLLVDISEITFSMNRVMAGTKSRSSACSQLDALIDLLESERSKGISDDTFFIAAYHDSKIRKNSRTEMAKGVVPTIACQEWISAARKLQVQMNAWNGHNAATDLYRSYIQSAKYRRGASVEDEITRVFLPSSVMEGHDAAVEAVTRSLTRIDNAIGRDDISTAFNEASAALRRFQISPRDDEHVANTLAYRLIERSKKLVKSVEARCNEDFGSGSNTPLAKQLDFMVAESVNGKEAKPCKETQGSS